MLQELTIWYKSRFSDPHLGVLFVSLLGLFFTIYFFGGILTPLFVALVLSYLLDWPVMHLMRLKISRGLATLIVMSGFMSIMIFMFIAVVPTVIKQGISLLHDLPAMFNQSQIFVLTLPSRYPDLIDANTLAGLMENLRNYVLESGGFLLSHSFSSLLNLAALIIYAILVPLMMVFMLKDKNILIKQMLRFLPTHHKLIDQVSREMNMQIMNYIRGKVIEIIIVGFFTYLVFLFLDLRYSVLLAVLVGFSVLIPYIGAVVVTVPVAVVALFQWGLTPEFAYLMLAYGIVQALDGNLVVPILFADAVNLHPVMIIIAVLIFGGLWGFWGVFFAIPLATLVKALLNAFPEKKLIES